jgi:hypothetical protein
MKIEQKCFNGDYLQGGKNSCSILFSGIIGGGSSGVIGNGSMGIERGSMVIERGLMGIEKGLMGIEIFSLSR